MTNNKKEYLVNIIKNMYPDKEIMFMYLCGAHVYGAEDEDSDYDVSVMLKGFFGYMHMEVENVDFFVYGEDYYLEKQRLNPHVPLYNRAHMDEVIDIDSRLIYLNPSYEREYNCYKAVDFNNILPDFLKAFIEFHEIRYQVTDEPAKRLYHVLRIRGQLDNYDETGIFTLECKEPWKSYYMNYKRNWQSSVGVAYRHLIKEQLDYIKVYLEKLEVKHGLRDGD